MPCANRSDELLSILLVYMNQVGKRPSEGNNLSYFSNDVGTCLKVTKLVNEIIGRRKTKPDAVIIEGH